MKQVRIALRTLAARPGFTLVAVVTLALGIGANTAVFTVVKGVMLDPLPYAEPSRVVLVTEQTPQFPTGSVSWQNYEDWRDRSRSFDGFGAVRTTSVTLTGAGEPERMPLKMLSASVPRLLGIEPAVGRAFTAAEDRAGGPPVVVIGHGLWERRFGGATDVLGRTLLLDGLPYTIVGVLPAGFAILQPAELFVPIEPWAATLPDDRGWHPGIFPVARLGPGATIESAQVEMDAIARQLEVEYPLFNRGVRAKVTSLHDQVVANVRPALLVLLGAVALLLLIACANVANLLLARAVSRQKEMAIRTAIGAGRGHLVRQLFAESVALGVIGGVAGVLVAAYTVPALVRLAGPSLPRADAVGVDWTVFAVALATAAVTGLVFGVVPAVQGTRVDVRQGLSEEGRGGVSGTVRHHRIRAALVVAEVATALLLLVGAGLMARSLFTLQGVPPGFDTSRLLVVDLPLSPGTYAGDAARTAAVDRLLESVRAVPGITAAAMTTTLPMAGAGALIHFNIEGRAPKGPQDYVMAGFRAVTPGYFRTLGVPVRQGRTIGARDREGSPRVVVINESMAREFFPGRQPIGQRLGLGTEPDPEFPPMEIVGVVGDVKQGFEAGAKSEMFVPYTQFPPAVLAGMYRNLSLVARTAREPADSLPSVRAAVRAIDPEQPLVKPRTMEEAMAATVAQPRFRTVLLSVFAAVAILLAVTGVYGVMAYGVSQRTHEIGVRIALGASARDVVRMVVMQGVRLAAAGIVLGLVGAVILSRTIASLLFNVSGWDPLTFVGAALIVGASALVASYVPARRAARVSAFEALSR